MGNLFNMDNPFFTTLSKICDILFLSVVWVLLCIPVITIGPASTAMYYATVKVIRRERGYLFREFFKSFRMNFKRGAIVGVLLTIVYAILYFDINYSWQMMAINHSKGSMFMGIFLALTFLTLCVTVFVFPILSRFEMTVKQLLKAGIYMAMRHLPFTFVMVVVTIATAILIFLLPILVFILPAASVFLNSFMMEHIFKRYMPKSEGSGEETGKDEWYLD